MQGPVNQPDELGALKKVVGEFIRRLHNVENEMDTLKDQKKDLVEEYKYKLDMKTLSAAIRAVKIKKKVAHRDTFDVFVELIEENENI